MPSSSALPSGDRPLRIVAAAVLAGLLLLLLGLWQVQVMSRHRYQQRQESQSFRTVRLPAMRGKILDRQGREFAGNSPRYRLDLYLDELRPQFQEEYKKRRAILLAHKGGRPQEPESPIDWFLKRFRKPRSSVGITRPELDQLNRESRYAIVSNIVADIGRRLGTPLALSEPVLYQHFLNKTALPLTLLPNCTPAQIALITEQGWSIPGVELELVPIRSYPHGTLGSHVIGHLQRHDDSDEDEDGRFDYRLRDYRGAMGLEDAYDRELRGQAGARSILVNSAGYRQHRGQELIAAPMSGLNLVTTLDLDLQKATEQALGSVSGDERGAVVVMNPSNGDILAMASAPSFDPAEFIDGVTPLRWTNFFLAEPATPLMNRATYGQYAPGSTFKIVDALALLEAGLDPDALFTVEADPRDPGHGAFFVGRRPIKDLAPPGEYDFRRAFIRSSNSYFIFHGLRLGWERLSATGLSFGLGQDTGIRIPEESAGDFPTLGLVKERGWGPGNLANVCIGQEITLTPLQLAVVVSTVANGGKVFWPRLVDRLEAEDPLSEAAPIHVKPGQVRSELRIRPAHFQRVRNAMRDDVLDNEGTGKAARLPDFAICGKTGTAEIKGHGRKDKVTWFASFAPFEAPRYVVIVMVESGSSGGGTCAPVARQIYEFLRNRERMPTPGLAFNPGAP